MSVRRDRRWFLPETPDVIGLLRRQTAATIEALDAFAAWAAGDTAAAQIVRDAEPRGDAARAAQRHPGGPRPPARAGGSVHALARARWVLDYARDLIEEAEVMAVVPDAGIGEMAKLLAEATRQLDEAIGQLGKDDHRATAAADAAIKTVRRLEHSYYRGTAKLLEVEEMRERIGLRELYRRCDRIGEIVIDVAERIAYAVVKQS